ncbi:MAG: hypothetical protein U0235_28715 [Polyangiaceae bacterium]
MIPSRATSLEPVQTPSADRPSSPRAVSRPTDKKGEGPWLETWLRSEEEEVFDLPCTD